MPDRYGLDRNGNDIIDLPNSYEYVHNLEGPDSCECKEESCDPYEPKFTVNFDAATTDVDVKYEGEKYLPTLRGSRFDDWDRRTRDPNWKPEDQYREPADVKRPRYPASAPVLYTWTIEGSGVSRTIGPREDYVNHRECLSEGSYLVRLKVCRDC
jgi:hypothetical protein